MANNKANIDLEYKSEDGHGFSLETTLHPEDAAKVMVYAMQLIAYRESHPELQISEKELKNVKKNFEKGITK